MKADRDLRRVIAAVVGAVVSFCVVAMGIYYRMADVRTNGFLHGGPTTLAAAMAGLFGGGLAAVVMLIVLLKWLNGRD
jgi:Na+/alanine symporter